MCVDLSVNLSVITLTLKQRGLCLNFEMSIEVLKFGTKILEMFSEKTSKRFFFNKTCRFFKRFFLRFFLSNFCANYIFSIHDSMYLCMVLKGYSSEIQNRDTKGIFEKILKHFFQKSFYLEFVCLSICLGYKLRKNWSILTKFGYVFSVCYPSLYTKIVTIC